MVRRESSIRVTATITLTKEEYEQLIVDSNILDYLMVYGVDNWDGYDNALELYHKDYPSE